MRLCLVAQEYPPETAHGGIGAQTYAKAHALSAAGHDVVVVSHSVDGERIERSDDSVRVIRIPSADARLPIRNDAVRWLTYSENVAAELARLESEAALDLIDFPEWASEGYVHLLNRNGSDRAASVIHLHGPLIMFADQLGWPDKNSAFFRVGRHMEETCLGLADAVFSSSACSADWCAREYGLMRDDIPVIHTGVDLAHFRRTAVPRDERPTVVFVGKLARNKGIDLLVEAALALAPDFPDLRLRLIGRGDSALADALAARAASAGYPALVELPGFVSRENLPAELSRADIFAAPSLYEGGPGFVYLEAMACGLPVLACSGSGASEAVQHGRTGLLVPPGAAGELAEALRLLLSDAELRTRLSSQAAAFVAAEADSRECTRRLEAFYEGVVTKRRGTPR